MRMRTIVCLIVLAAVVAAGPCAAKKESLGGVLAASVGDSVVLIEPRSGLTATFKTGPVGWLFPAPGGLLFAPDVINATTTVINLRSQTVADRVDGITMPHFGGTPDRYIAIAGEIMTLSWPDRAVIARIAASISNPWQVVVAPDDAAVIILERLPDASAGIHITTANLITKQIVYRRPLRGDVRHIALSPRLGILALADVGAEAVHLTEPSTLTPMASRPVPGDPVDVVFAQGDEIMVTAVATSDGAGLVDLAKFKIGKKGHRLDKERTIPLAGKPVRIAASPGGAFVAVAMADGSVAIIDVGDREIVTTGRLDGAPRDLRWCDPSRPGPMIPDWSDDEPDPPQFGTFGGKVKRDGSSGLEGPGWNSPPS